MKSFAVNEEGDLVFENGEIAFAQDGELLRQKVRALLGTNRGEWWLNESEGVDFSAFLCKHPNEQRVRDEVRRALLAIDEELGLAAFSMRRNGRQLEVRFTAQKGNESLPVALAYS